MNFNFNRVLIFFILLNIISCKNKKENKKTATEEEAEINTTEQSVFIRCENDWNIDSLTSKYFRKREKSNGIIDEENMEYCECIINYLLEEKRRRITINELEKYLGKPYSVEKNQYGTTFCYVVYKIKKNDTLCVNQYFFTFETDTSKYFRMGNLE